MRTRLSGGVAGVPRDFLGPLCRLCALPKQIAGGHQRAQDLEARRRPQGRATHSTRFPGTPSSGRLAPARRPRCGTRAFSSRSSIRSGRRRPRRRRHAQLRLVVHERGDPARHRGRYTTESDDRDEWIAFLEQLMKYRPEKPLNGVFVAVSVSDLLDATEDQIRDVASKVRARIDEMQTTLKMTLPVYVLFTKMRPRRGLRRVLRRPEEERARRSRGEPRSASLGQDRAEEDVRTPSSIGMVERSTAQRQAHEHRAKHARSEGAIFSFPLEFAAIKRNLADFMGAAFGGTGVRQEVLPTPILRGFYFTSGTQEGAPWTASLGAMGRAFGLKASAQSTRSPPNKTESRSYFLRDVFTDVVFPDQDVAAHEQSEIRRRRLQKLAIAFGRRCGRRCSSSSPRSSRSSTTARSSRRRNISTETGEGSSGMTPRARYDKVAQARRAARPQARAAQRLERRRQAHLLHVVHVPGRASSSSPRRTSTSRASSRASSSHPQRSSSEAEGRRRGQNYCPTTTTSRRTCCSRTRRGSRILKYFDWEIARLTQICGRALVSHRDRRRASPR
jgi:hypothetical protein